MTNKLSNITSEPAERDQITNFVQLMTKINCHRENSPTPRTEPTPLTLSDVLPLKISKLENDRN